MGKRVFKEAWLPEWAVYETMEFFEFREYLYDDPIEIRTQTLGTPKRVTVTVEWDE